MVICAITSLDAAVDGSALGVVRLRDEAPLEQVREEALVVDALDEEDRAARQPLPQGDEKVLEDAPSAILLVNLDDGQVKDGPSGGRNVQAL